MFTITAHHGITITAYLGFKAIMPINQIELKWPHLEYHRHYRS